MKSIDYTAALVALLLTLAVATESLDGSDGDSIIDNAVESFQAGKFGDSILQILSDLNLEDFLLNRDIIWGGDSEEQGLFVCGACAAAFDEILTSVDEGASFDVIFNMTIDFCIDFNISSPAFCENFIEIAKPQLTWIIQNTDGLTGKDICGTVFVGQNCHSNNPERVWEVEMPDVPKPNNTAPDIPSDVPIIKVLHLADTHYDKYYKPGSNANCEDKYFCCHEESDPLVDPEDAAGFWGDYRECDSPRWMLEALYTHVLETHPDISFIIWTGDIVPHNVWNTSEAFNLETIREAVEMVQQFFPNIPVFPAIGNHEAHPVNAFPQPYIDNEFDISWLYDEISTLWQTWLPADVADSIMYSAYYVTEIFSDLRILSVNTNYCYGYNWWLLHDSHDPGEVLDWMAKELQKAEDDGVYAYIISHIPSGHDDCGYTWSHEYNKIIHRYENSIAGIFYGHTHKDHFQLFFNPEIPDSVMKIGFVAQSQTTYSNLNPGYKVYHVDGDRDGATYTVLDHENWFMNLEKANQNMEAKFELLYTAREEYNMTDLSPESHLAFFNAMIPEGSPEFDLYFKNYYKNAAPYITEGCDEDCKYAILCRTTVSDTSHREYCDPLKPSKKKLN